VINEGARLQAADGVDTVIAAVALHRHAAQAHELQQIAREQLEGPRRLALPPRLI
jgi:hypothetical protein